MDDAHYSTRGLLIARTHEHKQALDPHLLDQVPEEAPQEISNLIKYWIVHSC